MNRRQLLKSASLATAPFVMGRVKAQAPPASGQTNGLIVRMQEPRNLETPPDGLLEWKTSTEQFYVRSHFAVPKIDLDSYRLSVTGHVTSDLSLTLKDMIDESKTTKPLTLECAGNGRVFLTPASPGLQWGFGAVSNAEWTGIPLGAILDRAKVKSGAVDVLLIGADRGSIAGPPSSPGPIVFERSLPIEKAKRDECLLATGMNGDPLVSTHGAPLRAVIGGWFGVASVKWLTKIVVLDRPFAGFWQTLDYSYWDRRNGSPSLVPLTAGLSKAIILKPRLNTVIPANRSIDVVGKAWAGERKVAKVEISDDGGRNWVLAKLTADEKDYCWREWTYSWKTPNIPGPVSLLARCTDDKGNTQPANRDPDRRAYAINHLIPLDLVVKS